MHKKRFCVTACLLLTMLLLSACAEPPGPNYYDSPEAAIAEAFDDTYDASFQLIDETWLDDSYLALTYLDMEYRHPRSDQSSVGTVTYEAIEPQLVIAIVQKHDDDRYTLTEFCRTGFPIDEDGIQSTGMLLMTLSSIGAPKHDLTVLLLDRNFEVPDPRFDLSKLQEVEPGVYFAIEPGSKIFEMEEHYYYD